MGSNYVKSVFLHLALLLLLLAFSFKSPKKSEMQAEHVITVDFSQKRSTSTSKKSASRSKPKTAKKTATKKASKPQTIKAKSTEKTALPTSQKPKVVPPKPDPQPTAEEMAAQRRAEERAAKKSKFANLLSKSKKKERPAESEGSAGDQTQSTRGKAGHTSSSTGNIKGELGNRQVLKTPTIKDKSQKKGRVVVKICVNAAGDVISSEYTMMGSTTSDSYLIRLAEEGVKGYKFSPSPNPKECGKVVINFLLK